jgi:leucyl-tRNA synthetase
MQRSMSKLDTQSEGIDQTKPVHTSARPRFDVPGDAYEDARSNVPLSADGTGGAACILAQCMSMEDVVDLCQVRSYMISDTYARFLRANRYDVVFSVAFDGFDRQAERRARECGVPVQEWVARWRDENQRQADEIGLSIDWSRSFVTSDPEQYRLTQQLFLTSLKRDLIHRGRIVVKQCVTCERDAETTGEVCVCPACQGPLRAIAVTRWLLRRSPYMEPLEQHEEHLSSWSSTAVEAQRAALGRVEGVELDANTFDGGPLTVFTPYRDSVDRATFIAVSPAHPEAEKWRGEDAPRTRDGPLDLAGHVGEPGAEQTRTLATVPGVEGPLPIVIAPSVDARFGQTAILGIPERDRIDRSIAERLKISGKTMWKADRSGKQARPRAAVRYSASDIAASARRAWGPPVPLINCSKCGTVPVPPEHLPVTLPVGLQGMTASGLANDSRFYDCKCPRCRGSARRATETISAQFDGMWMWMRACMPPGHHGIEAVDDPGCARWLPVHQLVCDVRGASSTFDQRLGQRMLEDLGSTSMRKDREPFSKVLLHGVIRVKESEDSTSILSDCSPQLELAALDPDTVRLAVLYAASPERSGVWTMQLVNKSDRFLKRLHHYADGRLREWHTNTLRETDDTSRESSECIAGRRIDTSDQLRRRLDHWCEVGCEKVTANLKSLEMQRAVHNVMRLLSRVEDFERRAIVLRGELQREDRDAIVVALRLLSRLMAPLAPHSAQELWSSSGGSTSVDVEKWPMGRGFGSRRSS